VIGALAWHLGYLRGLFRGTPPRPGMQPAATLAEAPVVEAS